MEPHSLRHVFLIASSFLVSLALSASARNYPCEFPAIFSLGDSNSDTGSYPAAFEPLQPPYGETYFHRPAGRYSDGRIIIDFIAGKLGLPYLSAYLDALGSNFTHGANFAIADAAINDTTYNPITLDVQLTQFSEFHKRSQIIREKGGVFAELMPKPEDFSRALYMFDIGQNDIDVGYYLNNTYDQIRAFIPERVDQIKSTIKTIYDDHGGRSFWVHGTAPYGCLPKALSTVPITASDIDDVGCVYSSNELAQYFNQKLKAAVFQLREELPEAAVTFVDIYSVKYDLISHAKMYGFEEPLTSCCGYGGKFKFSKNSPCSANVTIHGIETIIGSCEDPSVRISWDGIHYTEAANEWVAKRIIDGSYSEPRIPLEMACHR